VKKVNLSIRNAILKADVKQWEVAEERQVKLKADADKGKHTGNVTAVYYTSDDFERINNASRAKCGGEDSSRQIPAETLSDTDNKSS